MNGFILAYYQFVTWRTRRALSTGFFLRSIHIMSVVAADNEYLMT